MQFVPTKNAITQDTCSEQPYSNDSEVFYLINCLLPLFFIQYKVCGGTFDAPIDS